MNQDERHTKGQTHNEPVGVNADGLAVDGKFEQSWPHGANANRILGESLVMVRPHRESIPVPVGPPEPSLVLRGWSTDRQRRSGDRAG